MIGNAKMVGMQISSASGMPTLSWQNTCGFPQKQQNRNTSLEDCVGRILRAASQIVESRHPWKSAPNIIWD